MMGNSGCFMHKHDFVNVTAGAYKEHSSMAEAYKWSLMNYSVSSTVKSFGAVACKTELV
jgi:hypothetical protein